MLHCPTRRWGHAAVDVDVMYNAERYRPRYTGLLGHPLMLGQSLAAAD